MDKDQLYTEHLDEMFGTALLDNLTEEDVDRIITRVLCFLPNNGRLYKYRSIEGNSFEYAYDGLKNGYLYMARANTLNDDLDSTLNFDAEKDINKQMQLFIEKPWHYLDTWVHANSDQPIFQNPIDRIAYQKVMSCVNPTTYELDKEEALKLFADMGVLRKDADRYINNLQKLANDEIEKHAEDLKKPLSSMVNFNNESKKDIYVFSMSEDYDSDTMWAYYANSNKGFCIEYDYNKVKDLSFDKKRLLISIYKVIYRDQLEEHSLVGMLQYFIGGKKDTELFKRENRVALEHTITKLSKWQEEKEWRVFLCNLDDNNKIYADIVSGIIIDERALECDNEQMLIELAKEKGWDIKVRKRKRSGVGHYYERL